jgi:hypothetical protein
MNLRHAAALGLLGWYLLLPPYRSKETRGPVALRSARAASEIFNFDAPLSKWEKKEPFESERDCENEKNKLYEEQLTEFAKARRQREKRALGHEITRLQHGQCVAGDDPRLKGS